MADERTVVKSGGSNIGLIVLALAVVIAAVIGFMVYQSPGSGNYGSGINILKSVWPGTLSTSINPWCC